MWSREFDKWGDAERAGVAQPQLQQTQVESYECVQISD